MIMTIHRPAVRIACVLAGGLAVFASAASADTTSNAANASQPASVPKTTSRQPVYRELKWEELIPKDWDPTKPFRGRSMLVRSDTDPRAVQLMAEVRALWDNAPTMPSLDGAAVKLPGYVVPLDELRGELKEFLLVPYFGACIHMPPPPANQIILVVPPKGVKFRAMETVWVSGTLRTTRQESGMGASGYRIEATAVDPYPANR